LAFARSASACTRSMEASIIVIDVTAAWRSNEYVKRKSLSSATSSCAASNAAFGAPAPRPDRLGLSPPPQAPPCGQLHRICINRVAGTHHVSQAAPARCGSARPWLLAMVFSLMAATPSLYKSYEGIDRPLGGTDSRQ
jgi:hypothetical protein